MPDPVAAAPVSISKIDVQKLTDATALIAPFIPKTWMKSSIILLQIANIAQLLLGAFASFMPMNVSITIAAVLSILTIVFRVVNPNPPITGSPQDLTGSSLTK